MFSLLQTLKWSSLTQRRAALAVLTLYFLGIVLVIAIELISPELHDGMYITGGISGAVLFGAAWVIYFKYNWEPVRYFASLVAALLVGLFLPEPFVSQVAPMAVVIPVVLALILTSSTGVLFNAVLTIGILLARAGGEGVYANPATLVLYCMIVGGLVVTRLIAETSLRQLKEAQEATDQSEKRFRSLIENSSDEVSILDASGRLLYESPSSSPALGYRPGEFLGRNLFPLLHPDDSERTRETLARLVHDPAWHPREQVRLRDSSGTWRWMEIVGTNLLDEPSVGGIVLNYHDVTERVEAEEKVHRQLKRLNGLRVIDIAIGSSLDLRVTLDIVLHQALALLEVDAGAVLLVNTRTRTVEYAASRGFRSPAFQNASLGLGSGYAGSAVVERKTVHIANLAQPANGPAAAPYWENEEFVDYYGVPLIVKGDVKGVLEIYHRSPLQTDPEWLDFLEMLAGQAAIAIDNAQLFNSLQQANIELESRVAERTAELNRTNAELERASRTKDEFLATMSHELRTPLNSILGLSESLLEERRGSLNQHQQKSLQIIEASGRHLLSLINDVLDLSKIDAGMFDFHPEVISVEELCRSCMAFIKSQALKKSIAITYANKTATSKLYADPRRLKQILVNLLNNAVKFTLEKGHVTLEVDGDLEHDLIQFSVIDNGIGIAPADLSRLFQPFVQVDSSLSRQYEGTGLGLALVQKLTDLHGGSVQVESQPGRGSCFTISLPCKQDEIDRLENIRTESRSPDGEHAEYTTLLSGASGGLGTILLAEDNMSNVLMISEYLESQGYEVVVAHDGIEALEKAEETDPDVILMDIQMPAMDGLEAMTRLRADSRFADKPIVALTALAMPGDRERCLLAGANEYMSKPVSLRSLKQAIERFQRSRVAV